MFLEGFGNLELGLLVTTVTLSKEALFGSI
jgi:hypothetical protein